MFASSLVKHVLPYRSDTMSLELRAREFSWIQVFYVKKESNHNFQVECQICERDIKYASADKFKKHMSVKHQDELKMECDMQHKHDVWKYFYLTRDGKSRCIVCKVVISTGWSTHFLQNHLSTNHENKDLKPYKSQSWAWKYIDAEESNNFFGKCNLCDTKMTFPLMLENLRDHLRIHNFEKPIKRNVPMLKDNFKHSFYMKSFYTTAEEDFRVKCKHCLNQFLYVSIETIEQHMSKHKDISDYENYMKTTEERKIGWKGMRFIDDNAGEIECMICHTILPNKLHINDHEKLHSTKLLRYHTYWGFKYMRQLGDLAKCTICDEIVTLMWDASHLQNHMFEQHAKEVGELCRAVESSPSCTVL
nr:PREDICTED: uncharacterized protein LOC105673082 [Linepithema humile]XP_012223856.1 PREDICTED: uncharacterized protein LOC105673082 [Linepithema humile]